MRLLHLRAAVFNVRHHPVTAWLEKRKVRRLNNTCGKKPSQHPIAQPPVFQGMVAMVLSTGWADCLQCNTRMPKLFVL